MPVYTYRREDGTTFDYKQRFLDDPLTVCPTTHQHVVRVVQPAGIIFKGSGFYVNDSKGSKKSISSPSHTHNGNGSNGSSNGSETKSETKTETKSEVPAAAD